MGGGGGGAREKVLPPLGGPLKCIYHNRYNDYSDILVYEPRREKTYHLTCGQRRHKSACTFAHSAQSHRYLHVETLHHWLSRMRPEKMLIRLPECVG